MRTNGVEELVDIDLGLFPCSTCTRVRLFPELANDGGLQLFDSNNAIQDWYLRENQFAAVFDGPSIGDPRSPSHPSE